MPAIRHSVPMTPRAMRPCFFRLGRKKLLTAKIYHRVFPWQATRDGALLLYEATRQRKNRWQMRRALKKIPRNYLPLLFAFFIFATSSLALADTNFVDPAITDDNAATKQLTEILKKNGVKTDNLLDEQFLFASLIWGAVAGGYLLYARKQRETMPFIGGVAMLAVSFLVTSWFWMSLASIAIMVVVWRLCRQGY